MNEEKIGKYIIEKKIGRGGMAEVFLGHDPNLNRRVAIKVISPVYMQDKSSIARFEREAKIIAPLDHPNIVRIFDYGLDNEKPYMVMEYLEGITLSERIAEYSKIGQRIPLNEIVDILWPIASALDYGHERGIIHRDVKPSNIILKENKTPILLDFGVAKMVDDDAHITVSGGVTGSPAYLSPEQAFEKEATKYSDIYSMGCVLYEMAVGKLPFDGGKGQILMKHINNETPPKPTSVNPDLPLTVEVVILKALEKKPEDRYRSAGEMINTLYNSIRSVPGQHLRGFVSSDTEIDELILKRNQANKEQVEDKLSKQSHVSGDGGNEQRSSVTIESGAVVNGDVINTVAAQSPEEKKHNTKRTKRKRMPRKKKTNWQSVIPIWVAIIGALATIIAAIFNSSWIEKRVSQIFESTAVSSTQVPYSPNVAGVSEVLEGEFEMGSNTEEDEMPVHRVYLDRYWIHKTEVTNDQFSSFVDEEKYITYAEEVGYSDVYQNGKWEPVNGADWRHPQGPNSSLDGLKYYPVVHVSWNDAYAYCKWVGGRLPTEAEWEKAARGGLEGSLYAWGDQNPVCTLGTENGAQFANCQGSTIKVLNFLPNNYGLYDMAGNVWEWVADWYSDDYYQNSPANNPSGPDQGSYRILRGGSWYENADYLRVAVRYQRNENQTAAHVGFRCAFSP